MNSLYDMKLEKCYIILKKNTNYFVDLLVQKCTIGVKFFRNIWENRNKNKIVISKTKYFRALGHITLLCLESAIEISTQH